MRDENCLKWLSMYDRRIQIFLCINRPRTKTEIENKAKITTKSSGKISRNSYHSNPDIP